MLPFIIKPTEDDTKRVETILIWAFTDFTHFMAKGRIPKQENRPGRNRLSLRFMKQTAVFILHSSSFLLLSNIGKKLYNFYD